MGGIDQDSGKYWTKANCACCKTNGFIGQLVSQQQKKKQIEFDIYHRASIDANNDLKSVFVPETNMIDLIHQSPNLAFLLKEINFFFVYWKNKFNDEDSYVNKCLKHSS